MTLSGWLGKPARRSSVTCRLEQRGNTLIEALVAIVIVSVLLLGVMAAMSSTAMVSRTTGQTARTRAALAAVADRISTMAYPGCADAATINASLSPSFVPAGYTATITKVDNTLPSGASCSASTSVRMVTVRIDHAASHSTLTGQVVLRDPNARPA